MALHTLFVYLQILKLVSVEWYCFDIKKHNLDQCSVNDVTSPVPLSQLETHLLFELLCDAAASCDTQPDVDNKQHWCFCEILDTFSDIWITCAWVTVISVSGISVDDIIVKEVTFRWTFLHCDGLPVVTQAGFNYQQVYFWKWKPAASRKIVN